MGTFDDRKTVSHYADAPPRLVPGFAAMQQMALVLMEERAGEAAEILVVGAGGGLELKVFAEARPDWRFSGVDPSQDMLALAKQTLGPLAARAKLIEGTAETAPDGPFDAATCLLVLHFLSAEQRLSTLQAIKARLKPGAPLIVAHHSIAEGRNARDLWLGRYAAFAIRSGVTTMNAENAKTAIGERLPILSPEEDAALLEQSGFSDVSLFYAGFTFRGWVAYA